MGNKPSPLWSEQPTPQGYVNIRTPDGWKLKHRFVMEQVLGRELIPDERVLFKDGDRQNCDPDNLVVQVVKGKTLAQLYEKKAKLVAQLERINGQIELRESIIGPKDDDPPSKLTEKDDA